MKLEQQIENHFGLSNVITQKTNTWDIRTLRHVDTWLDWEQENMSYHP